MAIVQGYMVYTFFAVNSQDHTGHMIIVDAGNCQPIGPFGPLSMFGPFGALRAHGFGPSGGFGPGIGFWHGPFAPWQTHISGGGF